MKFATHATVIAALVASTSAISLGDDCDGKWCNKGLSYDYDEAPLRKAEADNVRKTQAYNGAKAAHSTASSDYASASKYASDTADADSKAGAAKAAAAAKFSSTYYKSSEFGDAESAHAAAVKYKESTLDASLKAADDQVTKELILGRKSRDLASATAAKERSDANLKSNQERVAFEKDQLHMGEN